MQLRDGRWIEHVHFELKDLPVRHNPSGGGPYWGYTPTHPDNYGYYNPMIYLPAISDENLSDLITSVTMERIPVMVSGDSYAILTLSHSIDPINLEILPASHPVVVYVYEDSNEPVSDLEIAQKISVIESAQRFSNRIYKEEDILWYIDFMWDRWSTHRKIKWLGFTLNLLNQTAAISVRTYFTMGKNIPKDILQSASQMFLSHSSNPGWILENVAFGNFSQAEKEYLNAIQLLKNDLSSYETSAMFFESIIDAMANFNSGQELLDFVDKIDRSTVDELKSLGAKFTTGLLGGNYSLFESLVDQIKHLSVMKSYFDKWNWWKIYFYERIFSELNYNARYTLELASKNEEIVNTKKPSSSPLQEFPSDTTKNVITSPTFKWQEVSEATKYALYVSKPPYGVENLVFDSEVDYGPITGTSFTLPITLQENITYRWNMRAGNDAGWGDFSSSWSFTTKSSGIKPDQAPVHLQPYNSAQNISSTPTFEWQEVTAATKYGLYISKPPYGPNNLVFDSEIDHGDITDNVIELPFTLEDGITYRWNMRAGNEYGWGPFSSAWTFMVGDEGPFFPTIDVVYNPGWNLIGLPVEVDNSHYKNRFPGAVEGTLYEFDGSYQSRSDIELGKGYWLRFRSSGNEQISGKGIESLTISLNSGWNLISGISMDVPISSLEDPANIIVPNSLYGFDGSYYQTDVIETGQGYWLRASDDGDITLYGTASEQTAAASIDWNDIYEVIHHSWSSIIIEDAKGNSRRLYLVNDPAEIKERDNFSLPPIPPGNSFDVRFSDGYYAGAAHNSTIRLQSSDYPLMVVLDDSQHEFLLETVIMGRGMDTFTLTTGLPVEIVNEEVEYVRIFNRDILQEEAIPEQYSLSQNYPNPFNPITKIQYALPKESYVKLEVFNMLGQRMQVLVDENQEAGIYEVEFDGSMVPSGVYVYRIQAGDFIEVKELVLIK